MLAIVSCEPEYQDFATEDSKTGGLVGVQTQLIGYVIGDVRDYDVSVRVFQGETKTTSIQVLKSFTYIDGDGNVVTTEEIEHETFTISEQATALLNFPVNYNDLKAGLTVNGQPFPDTDAGLQIGDFWTLTFVSTTSNGDVFRNGSSAEAKISVGTRYAGVYTIATGIYYHPDVLDGPASTYAGSYQRIIESVNSNTYKMTDIGPWEGESDNFFYFVINEDLTIDIPKEFNGTTQLIWGADELANCTDNPNELDRVLCDNFVIAKDSGKDIIHISYGYIRTSGTRQFDDVLIKN